MSPTLAERLKLETRALHTAAERSAFMATLLNGRMKRPAYCALLCSLHAIYAALEPALQRHAAHPLLAPVYQPALWRTHAIERDLAVLHGPRWAEALRPVQAALDYRARLLELCASGPAGLLAHAYVRYLGDLSGGQMLRQIVASTFADPGATAFYDFGDAEQTRALTLAFRAGLSAIEVDAAQTDEIVQEAKLAFESHRQLFDQLAQAFALVR